MNYKFVDIMPKDNKGYNTIEDMVLGIVKYLYKEMDYNDYFKGSKVLAIGLPITFSKKVTKVILT